MTTLLAYPSLVSACLSARSQKPLHIHTIVAITVAIVTSLRALIHPQYSMELWDTI